MGVVGTLSPSRASAGAAPGYISDRIGVGPPDSRAQGSIYLAGIGMWGTCLDPRPSHLQASDTTCTFPQPMRTPSSDFSCVAFLGGRACVRAYVRPTDRSRQGDCRHPLHCTMHTPAGDNPMSLASRFPIPRLRLSFDSSAEPPAARHLRFCQQWHSLVRRSNRIPRLPQLQSGRSESMRCDRGGVPAVWDG